MIKHGAGAGWAGKTVGVAAESGAASPPQLAARLARATLMALAATCACALVLAPATRAEPLSTAELEKLPAMTEWVFKNGVTPEPTTCATECSHLWSAEHEAWPNGAAVQEFWDQLGAFESALELWPSLAELEAAFPLPGVKIEVGAFTIGWRVGDKWMTLPQVGVPGPPKFEWCEDENSYYERLEGEIYVAREEFCPYGGIAVHAEAKHPSCIQITAEPPSWGGWTNRSPVFSNCGGAKDILSERVRGFHYAAPQEYSGQTATRIISMATPTPTPSFEVVESALKAYLEGSPNVLTSWLRFEATGEGFNPALVPAASEEFGNENAATPGLGRGCTAGEPVSCASGNDTESHADIVVPGRGVPLQLTRTYNSQAAIAEGSPGPFGYGWTTSFSDHLAINVGAGTVTVHQANGSTVSFVGNLEAPGSLAAPAWVQAKLTLNGDGTYTYTLPDQEVHRFDNTGRLTSVTDRNGNATTLTYSGGRLQSVTDAVGRKLTLSYNGEGFVESATDPMAYTVKYTYEGGNLASVTERGETEPRWRYKYDGSHQLTELIDGRGGKTINEYDSAHRVIMQRDPMARELTFAYSGEAESPLTTITNHATGSVTREYFNGAHEPTSITHGYGTPAETTVSSTYDSAGYRTSSSDGNGKTTTFTYDQAGNRISASDPMGDTTSWSYDSTHDVEAITTPKGEKTTIKRDGHGNPETVSRPAPGSTTQATTYHYGTHGELASVEDPLKRTWKYEYDAHGNRKAEIDPEGDRRTWAYNEDSQETSTVSPRGHVVGAKEAKFTTTIERDAQGRPTAVVAPPLKHETKYTYDQNGNLATLTDPEANKTTYTYDADNEPIKVEEPNKTIIETSYDGAGKVTSQINGNKHTTTYARDAVEQVTEIVDPLGRKAKMQYDSGGNLRSQTDAASRVTNYTYDDANRPIGISYSDEAMSPVHYEYDADGNRTRMVDGTGTSERGYDQLDRLTESKDGHGDVSSYEYDLADQQTKITYPNGKAVVRAYDNAGRLKSTTDWLEHTTKFGYDANSDLTATTFPAGTSNEDTYAYDEADRMSEVKMVKATETLASVLYARNKDGGVTKATTKGLPGEEKPAFSYDENSRLTKGAGLAYKYDAADNPTKIGTPTYTYDNADQLKTGTGLSYTFDEVGERIQTKPTSGPATKYGYDQAGNLTSVSRPKEGEVAAIEDTYGFDGSGLRASQTISATTSYLSWDVSRGLPVILSDGTSSYVYGPGDLPIEQINTGGTVTYLHHDQQGSTRLLTGSTGTVTGSTTFDAYGNKIGSTGTGTTPLGFDAQYTSTDTGLIYLRARVYDPATAQFLSIDPAEPITRAPYTYAGDNPLTYGDPRGLSFAGFLEEAGEGIAGWGDTLTFGATNWVREELGINNINACSGAYQAGGYAGLATGVLIPGEGEVLGAGDIAAGAIREGDVLGAAERWLGEGYREIAPGVYRSADDARQFRATPSDLGAAQPHVHFESIGPGGRGNTENAHVYLREW